MVNDKLIRKEKMRILVVDDDLVTRTKIETLLSAHGQCDTAEDAQSEDVCGEFSSDDVKPFDFETAVDEFGGNSEVVSSLIEKFIEEAELQIKNISQALESQDVETIRKEAHKIRGAAGNLVAMPLSLAAENLEELVKSGQIDDAAEKVEALEQEFSRLKEYV
jgi:HPt (histidine-containing phosphotransfer) domain-containing protein